MSGILQDVDLTIVVTNLKDERWLLDRETRTLWVNHNEDLNAAREWALIDLGMREIERELGLDLFLSSVLTDADADDAEEN